MTSYKNLFSYFLLFVPMFAYSSDSSSETDFSTSNGSQPSYLRDRSSDDEFSLPLIDDKEIDPMVNEKLREAIRKEDDPEILRIIIGGETYHDSDIQMGLSARDFTRELYERLKKENEEAAKKYAEAHNLKFSPVATEKVITKAEKIRAVNVKTVLNYYLPEEITAAILEFKP